MVFIVHLIFHEHLRVSINGGTLKWMVFVLEKPIKMDDLGVPPHLWKPPFVPHFFFRPDCCGGSWRIHHHGRQSHQGGTDGEDMLGGGIGRPEA